MVFLNYSTMEMVAKIVYYGPGLCGKTTNLKAIYQRTSPQARGEMLSLETETDRTLFFDLLPMEVGVIGGFKTKFQLYTVPGQVFYNTTRKLVLRGVDGIVFVADSQTPMMDANIESFQNLKENLAELNLTVDEIPLVLQYNKRDLPNVLPLETMHETLNTNNYPYVEASALNGIGVFETLREISKTTLMMLNNRNLGKKKAEPKKEEPAPPPPPEDVPMDMPEDVSFDDAPTVISPPNLGEKPKDSFEQTLNNLELDLSDDDDAFLEEDSLDMEEFDEWEEEDSLDSSIEDLTDDTSPGSFAPLNLEDDQPVPTLNLDDSQDHDIHSIPEPDLDELEPGFDTGEQDDDILDPMDGEDDLDLDTSADFSFDESPEDDSFSGDILGDASPMGDSSPSVDLTDDDETDLSMELEQDLSILAPQSVEENADEPQIVTELDPELEAEFGGDLEIIAEPEFVSDELPDDLLEDESFDPSSLEMELDEEFSAPMPSPARPQEAVAETPAPEPAPQQEPIPKPPVQATPPQEVAAPAAVPAPKPIPKPVQQQKPAPPVAPIPKAAPPKRKPGTSSGLDELKRITTRIHTSKLGKKKDPTLDNLLTDVLGKKDKKSKAEKFNIQLPADFSSAQLNCVFVDDDNNVIHTELLKLTPKKLEDGKYQIRLSIEVDVP